MSAPVASGLDEVRKELNRFDSSLFSVNTENMSDTPPPLPPTPLAAARDEFVAQWGAIGSSWGINRTMAQIHALLLTSDTALTTDDVMLDLKISRGNAHQNLRELVGWGLVRNVIRKGERKEFFEAEKDIWRMFCIIARERKRREIEPALKALKLCDDQTRDLKGDKAVAFNKQIHSLSEFVSQADQILEHISRAEENSVLPFLLKTFSRTSAIKKI